MTVDEVLRALFVIVGLELQRVFERDGGGLMDRKFDGVAPSSSSPLRAPSHNQRRGREEEDRSGS